MGLIQMIEYIEFHVDSYYETSRFFIFEFFSPPTLQIIKETGNWGRKRKKRKKSKQSISDLFGTPFKVVGIIQNCISSVQSNCSPLKYLWDEK